MACRMGFISVMKNNLILFIIENVLKSTLALHKKTWNYTLALSKASMKKHRMKVDYRPGVLDNYSSWKSHDTKKMRGMVINLSLCLHRPARATGANIVYF